MNLTAQQTNALFVALDYDRVALDNLVQTIETDPVQTDWGWLQENDFSVLFMGINLVPIMTMGAYDFA